ncbi:MAG: hypothetical protein WBL27_00320 [Salinimicrobium sp.]
MGHIFASADLDVNRKDQFVGQEIIFDSSETANRRRLNTVTGDIELQ